MNPSTSSRAARRQKRATNARHSRRAAVLGLLSLLLIAAGAVVAYGKGGTAKPPQGAILPAALITPTLPDPAFSVDPKLIHGFDDTGFIQDATVDGAAAPASTPTASAAP